jgi:hypothetical protein
MISISDEAMSALTRSWRYRAQVQSWRGGELLAADVPLVSGSEEVDRSLRVPERMTMTVPRVERGFSWDPVEHDHPLAAFGQRLWVRLGVDLGRYTEWFLRGEYLITDSSTEGDTVTVEAAGLLQLVDEARLSSPFQPSGTFVSTLRSLVEPALTVYTADAPEDRSVPTGLNWDEDRLGAVLELLETWPATAYVTGDGFLVVEEVADSTDVVLSLTDGEDGTVLNWGGTSSRDGGYNLVVARGADSDGNQLQAVAYDYSGPTAYQGPFNPLPVPYFYSSPLLTTQDQCQKAANTRLASLQADRSTRITATCVPHPALQAGDAVHVTGRGLTAAWCIVEALTLPYQPGEMTLTLRVV